MPGRDQQPADAVGVVDVLADLGDRLPGHLALDRGRGARRGSRWRPGAARSPWRASAAARRGTRPCPAPRPAWRPTRSWSAAWAPACAAGVCRRFGRWAGGGARPAAAGDGSTAPGRTAAPRSPGSRPGRASAGCQRNERGHPLRRATRRRRRATTAPPSRKRQRLPRCRPRVTRAGAFGSKATAQSLTAAGRGGHAEDRVRGHRLARRRGRERQRRAAACRRPGRRPAASASAPWAGSAAVPALTASGSTVSRTLSEPSRSSASVTRRSVTRKVEPGRDSCGS